MKRHQSLRFRIIASFTLVGFILGLTFGGIAAAILYDIEDQISEKRLIIEADAFLAQYRLDPSTEPPNTTLIRSYMGKANLPPLFETFRDKAPGVYELGEEHAVIIRRMDAPHHAFYLIQDNDKVEMLDILDINRFILIGILGCTLLSSWLGHLMGRRMLAPLHDLAREVGELKANDLPSQLRGTYYDDEVGQVARALSNALGRVSELIQREQRFTRDASHELRTPVTVIKGATELVVRLAESGRPIDRPMRRINRAVKDMENIIETFLYLGREGHHQEEPKAIDLHKIIEDLVEANRYLIEEKSLDVRIEGHPIGTFQGPEAVINIALGNLIRNAFQYTETGVVTIKLEEYLVQIIDTGQGMDDFTQERVLQRDERGNQGKGFGLGLSIVNDFCKRFGWSLSIESRPQQGTCVTLNFGY